MPLSQVGTTPIWIEESGQGKETIVFAHGLLWSGEMFAPQIAALSSRYRCVSFDFRGQGRSPLVEDGYDMETLFGDAVAILVQTLSAPCHFVGLSMGGFVGMRLAIRRPELLRSLTLIGTAADPEPRFNVVKYRAMLGMAHLVGFAPFAETVMKIMFGRAFLDDPARREQREALRARLLANDLEGVRRATTGVITREAVADDLCRIKTPTQVLHGADDRAIMPPRARQLARAIPGARFVLIPRAGHTATLEEPSAITEAIAAFVRA